MKVKLVRFDADGWIGLPEDIEFWMLEGMPDYQWVRTTGPYPEMFKWEWYKELPDHVLAQAFDEWELEELRNVALKEESDVI